MSLAPYVPVARKYDAVEGDRTATSLITAVACTDVFVYTGVGFLESFVKIWFLDKKEFNLVGTTSNNTTSTTATATTGSSCVGPIQKLKLVGNLSDRRSATSNTTRRLIGSTQFGLLYVWDVTPSLVLAADSNSAVTLLWSLDAKQCGEIVTFDMLQDDRSIMCAGRIPGKGFSIVDLETGDLVAQFDVLTAPLKTAVPTTATKTSPASPVSSSESQHSVMWQFTAVVADAYHLPTTQVDKNKSVSPSQSAESGRWCVLTDTVGTAAFVLITQSFLSSVHQRFENSNEVVDLLKTDLPKLLTIQAFGRGLEVNDAAWRPRTADSRAVCATLVASNGSLCNCFISSTVNTSQVKVLSALSCSAVQYIVYGFNSGGSPVVLTSACVTRSIAAACDSSLDQTADDASSANAKHAACGGVRSFVILSQTDSKSKENFLPLTNFPSAITALAVNSSRSVLVATTIDGTFSLLHRAAAAKPEGSSAHKKRHSTSTSKRQPATSSSAKSRKRDGMYTTPSKPHDPESHDGQGTSQSAGVGSISRRNSGVRRKVVVDEDEGLFGSNVASAAEDNTFEDNNAKSGAAQSGVVGEGEVAVQQQPNGGDDSNHVDDGMEGLFDDDFDN